MKSNFNLILTVVLFIFGVHTAQASPLSSQEQVRAAVLEYTQSKGQGFQSLFDHQRLDWGDDCNPSDRTSCVNYICDKVNSCQFESNFKEIAEACRGSSGDCVKTLCEKSNSCQFTSSAKEVAQACRRVGGMCVEIGCDKTNSCQFSSSGQEIAKACEGVFDGDCVKYACERLSCQFTSTFKEVARSCAGR